MKTTSNTLLSIATAAINNHVTATLLALEIAAKNARAAHLVALRAAPLAGVGEDDPRYPVLAVVADTITVGRESDGYPSIMLPDSTVDLLKDAVASGLLTHPLNMGGLKFHDDFSGAAVHLPEWSADYAAWKAVKDYRNANGLSPVA